MSKYLTFSFDDCEIYDREVCRLLRRYGMKGTFFLISGQLGFRCGFHRYGEDTFVERVCAGELRETYEGMEIGTHTAEHGCTAENLKTAVWDSAECLSELCGYKVRGMAYPGGIYTPEYIRELRRMGMRYARTAECTCSFAVPREWLAWNPTCRYDDDRIEELTDAFLSYSDEEDAVFHIYGHSYELTRREERQGFAGFEKLLRRLSGREDVIYATNMEVWEALRCTE